MNEILLIAFAFFSGHSLLLAALLFVKHRQSGNKLLGLILVLLTLRAGKSFVSLALPAVAIPVNIAGLMSMAALGPLLLFYTEELYTNGRKPVKYILIHLIPAFVCAGAWSWSLIAIAYYAITLHLLCYVGYSTFWLLKNTEINAVDNIRWKWSKGVLTGIGAISIVFTLQLFFYKPILYITLIGLAISILYILSIWAVRQNKLFTDPVKKKAEPNTEAFASIGQKVKKLMDEEIFIDAELTLSAMAKKMNLPPYLLSRAINICFNKSFPELILDHRIRKADQLLRSSLGKAYTIEAIAYESGFNTLSVFYQAFKKYRGMTPAQYRKSAGQE